MMKKKNCTFVYLLNLSTHVVILSCDQNATNIRICRRHRLTVFFNFHENVFQCLPFRTLFKLELFNEKTKSCTALGEMGTTTLSDSNDIKQYLTVLSCVKMEIAVQQSIHITDNTTTYMKTFKFSKLYNSL